MSTDTPRRFYKTATVSDDGRSVLLDARALKTPGGAPFATPTRALAEAIAAEWAAQGEQLIPATMPVTQLAFAAADHGAARREELIGHVLKYAETDLVCHRADAPAGLVARQHERWQSLHDWAQATLGVNLPVVTGIVAADVPADALARLRARAETLDDFALTGLAHAVGIAGSAVLGFAIALRAVTAETAFEAAALDDLWSLETWGEDAEARARLDRLRAAFEALQRYFASLATDGP